MKNKDIIMPLIEAVQKYGVKDAGANLGKAYSTLAGELNLNESSRFAKLGLDDAIELTRLTNDTTWISLLAQEFGLEVVAKKQHEKHESITAICAQSAVAFGDFLKKSAEGIIKPEKIVSASLLVRECIRKLESACLEALRTAKDSMTEKREAFMQGRESKRNT